MRPVHVTIDNFYQKSPVVQSSCVHLTALDVSFLNNLFSRYFCETFKTFCGGKDPEHLQAPSAYELAWSHALTLARDAEAEQLLCRCAVYRQSVHESELHTSPCTC